MRVYTVVLEYDPAIQAYSVRVPALRGCPNQGDTVEEALAKRARQLWGILLPWSKAVRQYAKRELSYPLTQWWR